ncbi:hypothetical protein [Modestobacter italicus]|uniref:hypothetical protein n=1 Tax=Modestobacter italicus (strain DSM 44449 / CECT 9708 / BC 501) TaxID=2732864 RepID=UPI001C9751B1|nr:hypothetical protein [Modestobacter italicus]
MAQLQWMSPEQYLARLMWELGIVPTEAAGLRICATEGFDRDAVRRTTQALALVREQLSDHWRRDGDGTLAEALDRAAADQWARSGLGLPPTPDPG